MKLIFLGSGSAFTVGEGNYHSNMILENHKGEKLLIDCGSDVRLSLYELGLTHRDINAVYISHLHADHVGGLEWLAFSTKFDPKCVKPTLFASDKLVDDLWNKVLSGGLSSIQDVKANLSTYYDVNPVDGNSIFVWEDVEFHIIQTIHYMSEFNLMPSFGLLFAVDGITVFITTDTQFIPHQMMEFYQLADIIFHDCEILPCKSGVHAHYSQLLTLDESIRNKMWLYHYNPGKLPDAKKDGFRGFVKKGQCFDFKNPQTLI